MAELDEKHRAEELQRKLEAHRQTTLTEELARLESFASSHVSELTAARQSEEDARLKELLSAATQRRISAEAELQSLEPQVLSALESAIKARGDARRHEEEALRKKAEEERIRAESARKKAEEEARHRAEAEQKKLELQKKKAEEEARLRAEAEQRKRKEEERQRAEAERKKKEDEHRRQVEAEQKRKQEEERQRLEQEARKKMEEELRIQQEEQQRAEEAERLKREAEEKGRLEQEAREKEEKEREQKVQGHLAAARKHLKGRDLPAAAAEAARALAVNPAHTDAISLDDRIRREQAAAQESSKEEPDSAKGARPSGDRAKKSRVPVLVFAVIVAGALLAGGILFFQLKKNVFPATTTVAVLPWSAGQGSGDDNLIGSSLAEEVARLFERSSQAPIIGFPTGVALVHGTSDPVQAAVGLGASYVLKGAIGRSGEAYMVNLQLVDSAGGTLWEKSYTKSADALAQLRGEVVAEIAEALKLPIPTPAAATKAESNGTAYVLYLKGTAMLHGQSASDLDSAFALFSQAASLEPEFSEALAGKAAAVALSYELGRPIPGASLEDAKKYSADAIANSPAAAEGYIARGMVFDELKQYRMALQQFDNALQHAPNSSVAFLRKAKVHLKVGQHEEGMNALTAALRLSPRDPAILVQIGQTYQLARATQEGFAYHEKAIHVVADSTAYIAGPVADAIMTDAALTLSQADRVAAALQRLINKDPGNYRMIYRLARLYQVSGKVMEAINLLGSAEQLTKERLQADPQDSEAAAYLALILTRQGKFTDAVPLAQEILRDNPGNARIGYIVAQMYALQMYSGKTMSVDEDVKKLCTEALQEALAADYRFDELASGDFYNMYEHSDFKTIIQVPLK